MSEQDAEINWWHQPMNSDTAWACLLVLFLYIGFMIGYARG